MLGWYGKRIDAWERALASRDTNRRVRPFEWGLDWLDCPNGQPQPGAWLADFSKRSTARSERFYSYDTPSDYRVVGSHLTFSSPVVSPHPENNIVHADLFPAARAKRAVLVLPQWNADATGHVGICKLLNRFGITALRMSLAYHDRRMPRELQRADYHVSSNIGRTIHASRQSVVDARACLDWLEAQGYQRLGILGTSLGSCVAFITAAHEPRIRAGIFNHVSMYFGDVVWTGLSTRHVRQGFGDAISQDELRTFWAVISPAVYLDRLIGRDLKSLLVWAKYDSTFLPVFSRQVVEGFQNRGLHHEVVALPCAHYTTGRFPFMVLDGLAMCRFAYHHL